MKAYVVLRTDYRINTTGLRGLIVVRAVFRSQESAQEYIDANSGPDWHMWIDEGPLL
jgi:hypothetical protein